MSFTGSPEGQATNGKRYDRQIRIWGAHGQARLEAARVCMLGASPAATEALKNLVLGGIESFTIVDDACVTERDLGNNFFFSAEDTGKGRAETATRLLRDLNNSVSGSFSNSSLPELISRTPDFFGGFSIVIAAQLSLSLARQVQERCQQHGTWLMNVCCHGPFATLQIAGPELCIIETKPDNTVPDLRLVRPWPELQTFIDGFDLANCEELLHKHVPYAVLLAKAIAHWQTHGSGPPSNAAQRREFKSIIQDWQLKIDNMPVEEENFQEAVRNAHTAWTEPLVPSEIADLMRDAAAEVTTSTNIFWVFIAALRLFTENEGGGALPLEGSIPDMTATTDLYIALQRIYKAKASEHCSVVLAHARQLLTSVARDPAEATPELSRAFCKHARSLRVVRMRPLALDAAEFDKGELKMALNNENTCNEGAVFLVLHAAMCFQEQHGRLPGQTPEVRGAEWEQDITVLHHILHALLSDLGLPSTVVGEELVVECCRAASASMHVVGAIMGGVAAQEAIKVLLRQFVPVDGVMVFNGIFASSQVLHV